MTEPSPQSKKVMVFGVFDRLHPGHLYFLQQAKKYGEKLIVVVARDSAVFKLKRRRPIQNEKLRMQNLRKLPFATLVILGDSKQGAYDVVKKYKPEVICFGYDQQIFLQDLRKKMRDSLVPRAKLIRLRAYKPKRLHSSLLNYE